MDGTKSTSIVAARGFGGLVFIDNGFGVTAVVVVVVVRVIFRRIGFVIGVDVPIAIGEELVLIIVVVVVVFVTLPYLEFFPFPSSRPRDSLPSR